MPIITSRLLRVATGLFTLISLFTANLVHAESAEWELGVGTALFSYPAYRGSDDQAKYAVPMPYFRYSSKQAVLGREGAKLYLYRANRWELDLSMDGSLPADSEATDDRQGMPNLETALELGPSLDFYFFKNPQAQFKLQLPIRGVITTNFESVNGQGFIFNPNIKYTGYGTYKLGYSIGAYVASQHYNDYYYSVAPAYATNTRASYTAPGGYGGLRATASLSRRFEQFWLASFIRLDDLHNVSFADSPLLTSTDGITVGLLFTWVGLSSNSDSGSF